MRNPIMVGERVYPRPFDAANAEVFAVEITHDPETFYRRGRFSANPIAIEHTIEEAQKPEYPSEASFVVCLRSTDQAIGTVNVEHLDLVNRTGETGSYRFAAFRNQGYGPEAKHLPLEYCFDRLHLHAVRSHVWEPNTRSAAALAKQGYRFAGRWRWDDYKDGVYRDTLVFDLLRAAWRASRGA